MKRCGEPKNQSYIYVNKIIMKKQLTPKEKAQELIDAYLNASFGLMQEYIPNPMPFAKQCALKAVSEIIDSSPRYPSDVDWDDCGATHQYYYESQIEEALKYWQEVKEEIEQLYKDMENLKLNL